MAATSYTLVAPHRRFYEAAPTQLRSFASASWDIAYSRSPEVGLGEICLKRLGVGTDIAQNTRQALETAPDLIRLMNSLVEADRQTGLLAADLRIQQEVSTSEAEITRRRVVNFHTSLTRAVLPRLARIQLRALLVDDPTMLEQLFQTARMTISNHARQDLTPFDWSQGNIELIIKTLNTRLLQEIASVDYEDCSAFETYYEMRTAQLAENEEEHAIAIAIIGASVGHEGDTATKLKHFLHKYPNPYEYFASPEFNKAYDRLYAESGPEIIKFHQAAKVIMLKIYGNSFNALTYIMSRLARKEPKNPILMRIPGVYRDHLIFEGAGEI